MVEGNTQHKYKEAIALLEEASPGTKSQMYFGFLKKAVPRFTQEPDEDVELAACGECGAVTIMPESGRPVCAFCKTKALAAKRKGEGLPAPVIRRREP